MAENQSDLATTALEGLLDEFRRGRIVKVSAERDAMERHAGPLTARWNRRFPGFPAEHFPYTSFLGEYYRKRRDAHLRDILVGLLNEDGHRGATVVNAACVFGRHACQVASRLPGAKVIGTDIDPSWHRIYRALRLGRLPGNYAFVKDDVFEPRLDAKPTAVVFFGACGEVTDGALDYGVASGARYVLCRTCCHDNIGGNVAVTPRFNYTNWFFRFKNWCYDRMRKVPKYDGFYFSPRYEAAAYPRSDTGKRLSSSDEFLAVARDSPDSDVCRAIIDLDRYLYLEERGYRVEYQGELLVAERPDRDRGPR